MGAVIAFASPPRRRPRPEGALDAPRCEILLFTGVRYERQADAMRLEQSPVRPNRGSHGRRPRGSCSA
jgi:hypothetical protein